MKTSKRFLVLGFMIVAFSSIPIFVQAFCQDRKTIDRPNTGYCTYEGGYMCLPGGYTCDGD